MTMLKMARIVNSLSKDESGLFIWLMSGVLLVKHGHRIVVLIFLLVSFQLVIPQNHASSSDSDIRLVRSDRKGVTVELNSPEYKIVQKRVGEIVYDEIVIGEYGTSKDAGKPALPLRGTLIGLPEKGNVTFKVTGSDYQTIHLERDIAPYLLPVNGHLPQVPDKDTYQADTFYPGHLAAEGFTGYMRDQHVKQILFYPVQYNPHEREVRIYRRIVVEAAYENPIDGSLKKLSRKSKAMPAGQASGAYEKLLKDSLLNYDSLQR